MGVKSRKINTAHSENPYERTTVKITRRAARKIELIVATRIAEQDKPKLNYDSLFTFPK